MIRYHLPWLFIFPEYKYVNGQAIKKKFKPEPGQKCVNRENIVYSLDFTVTPHQLRHTYITNRVSRQPIMAPKAAEPRITTVKPTQS
ncbi:MAG: hypothetical protein IJK77_09170 [Lachnospiraceae bacterium]|nr:hypothetical protein [Lachnospiraceae bacterium]